jgi:hypothetical protein
VACGQAHDAIRGLARPRTLFYPSGNVVRPSPPLLSLTGGKRTSPLQEESFQDIADTPACDGAAQRRTRNSTALS